MHAHVIGHAPGLAAPEAATSHPLIEPKDSAPVAVTTRSREENEQRDSASDDGNLKSFVTLREQLGAKGYRLIRAFADDGTARYFVGRRGLSRELADIAAVRAFAQQVGASDA